VSQHPKEDRPGQESPGLGTVCLPSLPSRTTPPTPLESTLVHLVLPLVHMPNNRASCLFATSAAATGLAAKQGGDGKGVMGGKLGREMVVVLFKKWVRSDDRTKVRGGRGSVGFPLFVKCLVLMVLSLSTAHPEMTLGGFVDWKLREGQKGFVTEAIRCEAGGAEIDNWHSLPYNESVIKRRHDGEFSKCRLEPGSI